MDDLDLALHPVVSAVGHEIDFSISDFVADRRAPTPSAAAELLSPDSAALLTSLAASARRLATALTRRIATERQRFESLTGRLHRAAPAHRLRQQQQQLDALDVRLNRAIQRDLETRVGRIQLVRRQLLGQGPAQQVASLRQRTVTSSNRLQQTWHHQITRRKDRLGTAARQLQALSPLATMQRGYGILRESSQGAVIDSVRQVTPGQRVVGLLADGSLDLRVERIEEPH